MRDLTVFEGIAIGAVALLLGLMASRPGVKRDDLAGYVGTGCLLEIYPTMIFGFLITCAHYIIFEDPQIIQMYAGMPSEFFLFEMILNGVFCVMAIFIAWMSLGKFLGIGLISAVSLGYYTYWLATL